MSTTILGRARLVIVSIENPQKNSQRFAARIGNSVSAARKSIPHQIETAEPGGDGSGGQRSDE